MGGLWEGSNKQTIPAIPWWAGGQAPFLLHLPLLQPVPSGLPTQPSLAQQAGIPGCASPDPARGESGLESGVCEGFCCFVLFFSISSSFRALVFPSPEALTSSCASLWLSHPSLHLCHHLPEVSCQLWAQGASGPVNLSSCAHPSPPHS